MNNIFDAKYVVFDLEATYNPSLGYHEIIEIGALQLSQARLDIVQSYDTLVKPRGYIHPEIQKKTGITSETVCKARTIEQVWDEFLSFVDNSVLVGHQVGMDLGILKRTSDARKFQPISNESLDTLAIAKKIFPKRSSYSLQTFKDYLEIDPNFPEHRAIKDAYITALLFKKMINILVQDHGFTTLEQVVDYCHNQNSLQMNLF